MPLHYRARSILVREICKMVCAGLTAATLMAAAPSHAGEIPTFAVDASWPKPLPNNWILGQVGGITMDAQGHIWVIHRPRSLTDDEKGATLNPPRSKCCVPAPPVLNRIPVFRKDGTFVKEWFYEKNTRGNGAVWDIAIWPDPKQTLFAER